LPFLDPRMGAFTRNIGNVLCKIRLRSRNSLTVQSFYSILEP
jgi:hypothetical protein